MKRKRYWQIGLAVVASPLAAFWMFYFYRWCLMGKWVEGGGDRAMAAFLVSLVLLAPIPIMEIDA